jgi:hypothetical protein
MLYDGVKQVQTHAPVGIILDTNDRTTPLVDIRSPIYPGESIEFLGRNFQQHNFRLERISNREGTPLKT